MVTTTTARSAAGLWPSRPRLVDILLGKVVTLIIAATALALGIATFAVLSRGMSLTRRPHVEAALFISNLIVLLLLAAALAGRLTRVVAERRRGLAGAGCMSGWCCCSAWSR